MGGYGVSFGDHRDTAEYTPVNEEQTNNRGELRAALRSLQGHIPGQRSLICPDSLLVVNGVLGWAQRWRRHKWHNTSGSVKHVDLWELILELTDRLRDEVKWLHVPSHIGIKGNGRADHLADVGRRRSPLAFGHISICPPPPPDEEPLEQDEESLWVWEEAEFSQPRSLEPAPWMPETPLPALMRTLTGLHPTPPTPLWDIEICTPAQTQKKARYIAAGHSHPFQPARHREGADHTPAVGSLVHTLYRVGPVRNTFRTPQSKSPLSPQASRQLRASLELVAMEGKAAPGPLDFEDSSQETRLVASALDSPSTASTVSCSSEGSRCVTPEC